MNKNIYKIKSNHYSYSKINTFFNCPQRYKIIYIDKIKNNSESIEAFMGKIVHSVLEWIFKENINFQLFDTLVERYKLDWNNSWHKDIFIAKINLKKEFYYKLGIECLRNFYKNYHFSNNIKEFKTEFLVETQFSDYVLKGVIDRLDIYEDRIYINDYKTGKAISKKEHHNNLQLFIYFLAIQSQYPNKKIILNWYYLRKKKNQIISLSYSKDDIERLMLILKDKIKKIELLVENNKFQAKESLLCNWCYYWKECSEKKQYNFSNPSLRAL